MICKPLLGICVTHRLNLPNNISDIVQNKYHKNKSKIRALNHLLWRMAAQSRSNIT